MNAHNGTDHTVNLSYDVTVTTTYRIKAHDQPSFTRARQQLELLRQMWGDDPTQWPEAYGDIEVVKMPQADWKLNDVAHVRANQGFEPIEGFDGSPDLGGTL